MFSYEEEDDFGGVNDKDLLHEECVNGTLYKVYAIPGDLIFVIPCDEDGNRVVQGSFGFSSDLELDEIIQKLETKGFTNIDKTDFAYKLHEYKQSQESFEKEY